MGLDWLFVNMERWRDASAIVWRDHQVTYGELLRLTNWWLASLSEHGMQAGDVVAIEGDYSPNICACLLALIQHRAIVVPLTSASADHRDEFLRVAEVGWVLSFDDRDDWSLQRLSGSSTHPLIFELRALREPGLVLFSSGSTGRNKAALHNFNRLLDKFKLPRQRLTALSFLLFDHIGGINTLLYALSNGGTVVVGTRRDPLEICRLVERYRVELLPTSPTFLNLLLLSEAYKGFDLSSLKLITYGTEVMPESTLRRLREAFPDVRLQQTYGLTELGILRSKSRDSNSLWVKVGGEGVETKILDGTLRIRTSSAMLGYLNAPSPIDADGWMDTQDAVESDGEYIRIIGRTSDIINVGGNKVYPAEVESVLMQIDNVADATVYGEPNPITGQIVASIVRLWQPEHVNQLSKRIRAHARRRLAPYKVPVKIVVRDQLGFTPRYKKVREAQLDQ
jgi:long-chain acyl-CoA synthetase